jgi:hypothetical protein
VRDDDGSIREKESSMHRSTETTILAVALLLELTLLALASIFRIC